MSNPFGQDEITEDTTVEATSPEVAEDVAAEADLDVDTPELDEADETDTVEEPAAEAPKEKKAKEKKAPARPPVPEGYITPVAFAKVLSEKLGKDVPPQYIYSTINSTKNGKNPLPTYSEGGRDNLLKLEEALAWWEQKDTRVAERKANAASKAEKKANKAEAAPAEAEVIEAEGNETELVEAE
jgi:hypothetical protein